MYLVHRTASMIAFAYPPRTTSDNPKAIHAKIDNELSEMPNQNKVGNRKAAAARESKCV